MNALPFITDFAALGGQLRAWLRNEMPVPALDVAVQQSVSANSWFTPGAVRMALRAIADDLLDEQRLRQWLLPYAAAAPAGRIGVVMAGNLPLVGFHDFLCVLAAGHYFAGKRRYLCR
jgi:hypothetical protein